MGDFVDFEYCWVLCCYQLGQLVFFGVVDCVLNLFQVEIVVGGQVFVFFIVVYYLGDCYW